MMMTGLTPETQQVDWQQARSDDVSEIALEVRCLPWRQRTQIALGSCYSYPVE